MSKTTNCFHCKHGELEYGKEYVDSPVGKPRPVQSFKPNEVIIRIDRCGSCGAQKYTYMTNMKGERTPAKKDRGVLGAVYYVSPKGQ